MAKKSVASYPVQEKITIQEYPICWIGRGGPVLWPPRSPDLTHLDFFLWGYLKNLSIETQLLWKWLSCPCSCCMYICGHHAAAMCAIPCLAHTCLDRRGGHFEHLPTWTYGNKNVEVYNKVICLCTGYDVIIFFAFSRNLWIVEL